MALTQSALRLPGPSWDEEVVPALRKRLQSESRTLSKRMSAISLSGDDLVGVGGTFTPYNGNEAPATRQNTSKTAQQHQHQYQHRQPNGGNSQDYPSGSRLASGATTASTHPNTAQAPSTTITTTTASPHTNGSASASNSFQRSRTYSQPDSATKMRNGGARPSDPKPTRIPKPSRAYASHSNGSTPVVAQSNGFAATSYAPHEQHDYSGGYDGDYYDASVGGTPSSHLTTSSTSRSLMGLADRSAASGLLNESPPFPPSSSATSLAYTPTINGHHDQEGQIGGGGGGGGNAWMEAAPSRQSMESEEQPFEHWYRGEVSRNGGVGELRVGRRQEMLDIANYGHMIRTANQNAKRKASPAEWGQHSTSPHRISEEEYRPQAYASGKGRRKRAGSIGGLWEAGRVRGSVYFDEERMNAVGRVLDENPLTDLDDDGTSDVASLSSYNRVSHNYIPGVGDISTTAAPPAKPTLTSDMVLEDLDSTPRMDDRSTTPTPMSSSQRAGQHPPSRIPGPSRPRRSSEARAGTPSTLGASTRSMNASTSSTSKTPSPPLVRPSASGNTNRSVSGQSLSASQQSGGTAKKVSVPSTPVKRRAPTKSLKGKQTPIVLPKKDNRQSVGQYPSPGDDEDMADAIPTWTQPVPRTGNWDEVVLPVVARQKGLDGHYKTADGSPQVKRTSKSIAPAPGTFGFDHTKYRRSRTADDFIPLDDFGTPEKPKAINEDEEQPSKPRHSDDSLPEERPPNWPSQDSYNKHEQTRLPAHGGSPPPSPPPFAHYAPNREKVLGPSPVDDMSVHGDRTKKPEERRGDEESAGCCKCTIM